MATTIAPTEAKRLWEQGEVVFIDVREPDEFAEMRITGAKLQPLSVLSHLPQDDDQHKAAVYFCRSGRRTAQAAAQLQGRGHLDTLILDGGLNGWLQAGFPVAKSGKVTLPLQRQVHIAAGSLILLFLILGQFAPILRILVALVGCGLLVSGLTGTCGMALLLARLPWNKKK
ncbi:MAG: rhodanese family protein [Desulfobulbaceae bacterium]|jgi:rhodanese-related sulfurtransferase|nr:rhodanese family protein [Desulfobulbaceae bacterium]